MQGWNELEWGGGEDKMSIESRVSMHGHALVSARDERTP